MQETFWSRKQVADGSMAVVTTSSRRLRRLESIGHVAGREKEREVDAVEGMEDVEFGDSVSDLVGAWFREGPSFLQPAAASAHDTLQLKIQGLENHRPRDSLDSLHTVARSAQNSVQVRSLLVLYKEVVYTFFSFVSSFVNAHDKMRSVLVA